MRCRPPSLMSMMDQTPISIFKSFPRPRPAPLPVGPPKPPAAPPPMWVIAASSLEVSAKIASEANAKAPPAIPARYDPKGLGIPAIGAKPPAVAKSEGASPGLSNELQYTLSKEALPPCRQKPMHIGAVPRRIGIPRPEGQRKMGDSTPEQRAFFRAVAHQNATLHRSSHVIFVGVWATSSACVAVSTASLEARYKGNT